MWRPWPGPGRGAWVRAPGPSASQDQPLRNVRAPVANPGEAVCPRLVVMQHWMQSCTTVESLVMRLDKRTWSFLDSLRSRAMTPKLLLRISTCLSCSRPFDAVVPGLDLNPIMTTSNACPQKKGQGTARDIRQPPLFRPTRPLLHSLASASHQ